MGLEKTIEKLDKYHGRLAKGEAAKIKPSHLKKVAQKLRAKEAALIDEIAQTAKPDKKDRLARKLALVRDQQARAKWIAERLGGPESPDSPE